MKRLLTLFLLTAGLTHANHCSVGVDKFFLGELGGGWRARANYQRHILRSELTYLTFTGVHLTDLSVGVTGSLGPLTAGVRGIGSFGNDGIGFGGGAGVHAELSLGGVGLGGALDAKRYGDGVFTIVPEVYGQLQMAGFCLRGGVHVEIIGIHGFLFSGFGAPFVGAALKF